MQKLKEWTQHQVTAYPKEKAGTNVSRKTPRRSPLVSEAAGCKAVNCDKPATTKRWTCRRQPGAEVLGTSPLHVQGGTHTMQVLSRKVHHRADAKRGRGQVDRGD